MHSATATAAAESYLWRERERRESIKVDFTTNDYRFVSCDDDDAMLLGTDNRFNRTSRSERKIAL